MITHPQRLWICCTPGMALLIGGCTTADVLPDGPTDTPPPEFKSAVFYYFPDQAIFNSAESIGSLLDFCSPPRNQPGDTGSGAPIRRLRC